MPTPAEVAAGLAHLSHEFMRPQIWLDDAVEDADGNIIPADYGSANDRGPVSPCGKRWFAQLSAPGYLDCTEPAAFDTIAEAEAYLVETYADDIDFCDTCKEIADEPSAD